jgi:TolA-binding protein
MASRLQITDEFTEKLMGKGFSVSLPLEEAAIVEKEANRLGLPAASIIRLMMRDGQQRRELERQVDNLKARMELLQVQFQGLQILLETISLEQANARGPQALENRKALIQEIRKRQGLVEG